MTYLTVPLNSNHKKDLFDCEKKLLDNYLHRQAKQDVQKKLSACFVLVESDSIINGYYTLSSASVKRDLLPPEIIKKLPPSYHQDLPATLLGRLAIDKLAQGRGYGELILLDAFKRSLDTAINSIGSMAVVVSPIDDQAVQFYEKYGFILLPDSRKMFIPMATIGKLFESKSSSKTTS